MFTCTCFSGVLLSAAVSLFGLPGWGCGIVASSLNQQRGVFPVSKHLGVPLAQDKLERTAVQKKIDSQLLFAIQQMRGEAEAGSIPTEEIKLRKDNKDRVLVDVRASVSKQLIARIKRHGGKIVSSSARDESIVAYIPLAKLESLAQEKDVRFIMPAAEAITN
jgi:hypothetical protein